MDEGRLRSVLERLAAHQQTPGTSIGTALCATGREVAGVDGAAIGLYGDEMTSITIGSSNDVMSDLEELERGLGEGPCIDAYRSGATVAEPDLANPATTRWIAFTAAALEAGARSAFGYPLQAADIRFGALNLYAATPGSLTDEQHADTLVLADVVTHVVITSEATGSVDDLLEEFVDLNTNQLEVHQAAGMISVQAGTSITDALIRLRAHAFAEDRPVSAVAADVVARRLRFQP